MREQSYRAIQVSTPGKFEMVERAVMQPPPGKVRIRVEACGVCHSDAITVESLFPNIAYPRVPGHEVIGKSDALGEGVPGRKISQRVAVGYLAGPCIDQLTRLSKMLKENQKAFYEALRED